MEGHSKVHCSVQPYKLGGTTVQRYYKFIVVSYHTQTSVVSSFPMRIAHYY